MLKAIKIVMIWFCAGFLLLGPAFSAYSAHLCLQKSEAVSSPKEDCCNTNDNCCDELPGGESIVPDADDQQCCVDVSAYFNFPVFSEKMDDAAKVFLLTLHLIAGCTFKLESDLFIASFIDKKVHPPNLRTVSGSSLSFTGVYRV